jgi:hypothetical protein
MAERYKEENIKEMAEISLANIEQIVLQTTDKWFEARMAMPAPKSPKEMLEQDEQFISAIKNFNEKIESVPEGGLRTLFNIAAAEAATEHLKIVPNSTIESATTLMKIHPASLLIEEDKQRSGF